MRALRAALTAWLGALAAGCGWHVGPMVPPSASHARTVGIEIFSNESPEPDVEAALHGALSSAVLDLVGLNIAPCDRADLIVRGTLGDYRRRGGVHGADNELLETGLRLDVSASLLDRSTGMVLKNGVFKVETGYALDAPADERAALERNLRRAAERIVLELFAPSPQPAAAPAAGALADEAAAPRVS